MFHHLSLCGSSVPGVLAVLAVSKLALSSWQRNLCLAGKRKGNRVGRRRRRSLMRAHHQNQTLKMTVPRSPRQKNNRLLCPTELMGRNGGRKSKRTCVIISQLQAVVGALRMSILIIRPRELLKVCSSILSRSLVDSSCLDPLMADCDNCLKRLSAAVEREQSPCVRPQTPESRNTSCPSSANSTPSKTTNTNGKRPMTRQRGDTPAIRRGEHLKTVRAALTRWRFEIKTSQYSPSFYTASAILPDKTLTTLASNSRIKTINDMAQMLNPPWIFASRHGEVLKLLKKLDDVEKESRENAKKAKKEEKRQETVARQNVKAVQAQGVRLPLTPQRVLRNSTTFNTPLRQVRHSFCLGL